MHLHTMLLPPSCEGGCYGGEVEEEDSRPSLTLSCCHGRLWTSSEDGSGLEAVLAQSGLGYSICQAFPVNLIQAVISRVVLMFLGQGFMQPRLVLNSLSFDYISQLLGLQAYITILS